MEEIKIGTLAGGAVEERFNQALKKVLANVQDPNTDHKKKRTITVKVTIASNEERSLCGVDFEVKETLAPAKNVQTALLIGQDGQGKPVAAEYLKQVPGQTYVDTESGEIIDFQRKANNQ